MLEAYHMILSLPEVFTQETGKSVVLIFDEFGHLENFNIPEVFAELGKRIMTQKNCLYIVASSSPQQTQTILSEKLSLLFGGIAPERAQPALMHRSARGYRLASGSAAASRAVARSAEICSACCPAACACRRCTDGLRRRIVEFNSGRNNYGYRRGDRRKPDTDDNRVRNGSVRDSVA